MKKILSLLCCLAFSISANAAECWEVRMILNVPRVFDNAQSLGYRAYQTQKIKGYLTVEQNGDNEPTVAFCSLENLTHKVGGLPVSYKVVVNDVIWHGIGSNATGSFPIRSVTLSIYAEPSYAIGEEPTNDNSFVLTLSGRGNASGNVIQGYVAGTQGCGCAEYGHVSPTRIWGTSSVVDIASTYGRWRAKRIR